MTTQTQPIPLTKKERKDLRLLVSFTAIYCRHHHNAPTIGTDVGCTASEPLVTGEQQLCSDCRDFLGYAVARRIACPLEPKPVCKQCPVHCYKPVYRQQVKEVMRFSGQKLLRRGRIDLLWHLFF